MGKIRYTVTTITKRCPYCGKIVDTETHGESTPLLGISFGFYFKYGIKNRNRCGFCFLSNTVSVLFYGELHQKRYFRKLRQSKGFRPQAGGFAHAFFTFLGCFECNQKRYFLIFINDEELLHWMLLTCKLRVNILTLGLFHISSASPIIML